MTDAASVAIRIDPEGNPVRPEVKLTEDVTAVPGEAYTVPRNFGVAQDIATGVLVELADGEEVPQPRAPAADPLTAADFLE